VLSTQVSTAGLRLRHNRLTRGVILEVIRDAAVAGEEELVSCAAEQSKQCSICTVTLGPYGDLPVTSWGRWECLRGGVDVGLNSCYAACDCDT
jgi:transposase